MRQLFGKLSLICALSLPAGAVVAGDVYVMSNDPAGNEILFFDRAGRDIRLRGSIPTEGLGAGDNADVDPLGSQDALLLSENRKNLYAVNAGSDQISVFKFTKRGLPQLLQVVSSGGSFPVSLTQDDALLYVVNTGDDGNITGFTVNGDGTLEPLENSTRSLGLGGAGIPVGGIRNEVPGQIAFDTLNRRLLLPFLRGGELISFAVNDDGTPSEEAEIFPSAGAAPFSLTFHENGTALVVEASGSLSSYNYVGDNTIEVVSSAVSNDQALSCWVRVGFDDNVYVSNSGSGSISHYRISRNGELKLIDNLAATGLDVPTDIAVSRNGRRISILESGGGTIRNFRIREDGSLRELSTTSGVPSTSVEGFSSQGIVIR